MRRGFKTEANALAGEVRAELGLGLYDRLDPHVLAGHLEIPVWTVSEFVSDHPKVAELLGASQESFSAITVFAGRRRTIVHNDSHGPGRQHSNLAHELAHGLLGHPPTPALDNRGCRDWNQELEDEPAWLGGTLLVSEPAALAIAKGRWTRDQAVARFGVSAQMIQYRLNATGAVRRVQRARQR